MGESKNNYVESEICFNSDEDITKIDILIQKEETKLQPYELCQQPDTTLPPLSPKIFTSLQEPLQQMIYNQISHFASNINNNQRNFNTQYKHPDFQTNQQQIQLSQNIQQPLVVPHRPTQQSNISLSHSSQIWISNNPNQLVFQNLPTLNNTNQLVQGTMIPIKIIGPLTMVQKPIESTTTPKQKPTKKRNTKPRQKPTANKVTRKKVDQKRNTPKPLLPIAPKGGTIIKEIAVRVQNSDSTPQYKNPFVYPLIVDRSRPLTPVPRTRTDDSRWYCILCKGIFSRKQELMEHYEEHRQEQLVSGKSSQKADKIHIQYHFQCKECSLDFFTYVCYCNHNDHQHNKNLIKCPDCIKMCKNRLTLSLHLNDVHFRSINYKCIECTYESELRVDLIKHMDCHNSWKHFCDQCDQVLSSATMYQEHKSAHVEENLFKCLWCDSSFTYSHTLIDHMCESHASDALELKCKQCDQVFGQQKSLIMHMRCHESDANLCDTCGKSFRTKQLLQSHIMNIHKKNRNYSCTVCGNKFAKLIHLKAHLRSHTGEKPFKCNLCDKSFTRRSNLLIHRRNH